jgi:hypothetical protein
LPTSRRPSSPLPPSLPSLSSSLRQPPPGGGCWRRLAALGAHPLLSLPPTRTFSLARALERFRVLSDSACPSQRVGNAAAARHASDSACPIACYLAFHSLPDYAYSACPRFNGSRNRPFRAWRRPGTSPNRRRPYLGASIPRRPRPPLAPPSSESTCAPPPHHSANTHRPRLPVSVSAKCFTCLAQMSCILHTYLFLCVCGFCVCHCSAGARVSRPSATAAPRQRKPPPPKARSPGRVPSQSAQHTHSRACCRYANERHPRNLREYAPNLLDARNPPRENTRQAWPGAERTWNVTSISRLFTIVSCPRTAHPPSVPRCGGVMLHSSPAPPPNARSGRSRASRIPREPHAKPCRALHPSGWSTKRDQDGARSATRTEHEARPGRSTKRDQDGA